MVDVYVLINEIKKGNILRTIPGFLLELIWVTIITVLIQCLFTPSKRSVIFLQGIFPLNKCSSLFFSLELFSEVFLPHLKLKLHSCFFLSIRFLACTVIKFDPLWIPGFTTRMNKWNDMKINYNVILFLTDFTYGCLFIHTWSDVRSTLVSTNSVQFRPLTKACTFTFPSTDALWATRLWNILIPASHQGQKNGECTLQNLSCKKYLMTWRHAVRGRVVL